MFLGLPPFPTLPPVNLSGIAPLSPEFLAKFPLVSEIPTLPTDLLSSAPVTSSFPVNPGTTVNVEQTSALILDTAVPPPMVTTAASSAPAAKALSPEDRGDGITPFSEKPAPLVTDTAVSESS